MAGTLPTEDDVQGKAAEGPSPVSSGLLRVPEKLEAGPAEHRAASQLGGSLPAAPLRRLMGPVQEDADPAGGKDEGKVERRLLHGKVRKACASHPKIRKPTKSGEGQEPRGDQGPSQAGPKILGIVTGPKQKRCLELFFRYLSSGKTSSCKRPKPGISTLVLNAISPKLQQ